MFTDLTTTLSGAEIASADVSGVVRVWSLSDRRLLGEFPTSVDPLGSRLALVSNQDGLLVVTGSWDRREVGALDVRTGARIWVRPGLSRVQQVAPARSGSAVAVAFDRGPIRVLDGRTGDDLTEIRGGRAYWQSPFAARAAVMLSARVAVLDTNDWHVLWTAPVAGFATLAAAFSRTGVLVSDTVDLGEASGPGHATVTAYSLTGERAWTHETTHETNVPWLGWDAQTNEWLGVEHHVNGTPSAVVRWSDRGRVVSRAAVRGPRPYVFAAAGRSLVSARGELIDLRSMDQVASLT